tara:strand:- start:693 stop:1130 length:438 start_codon:yes stop_codon:yes gene_type:complete
MGGAIVSAALGAGFKLLVNVVNYWLEHKKQNQLLLAARDEKVIEAILNNQIQQASDPFVKVTRRVLFMTITFTMCYLMIFYALNPHITYDVIVPRGESAKMGFMSWFTGGDDWVIVKLSGGLLLTSFMDLCFMIVGFYAVPSRMR